METRSCGAASTSGRLLDRPAGRPALRVPSGPRTRSQAVGARAASCARASPEHSLALEYARAADALSRKQGLGPSNPSQGGSGSGPNGIVYLVGTGPGDPWLLTLRAVHLMQTADVVLYDRLVSPEILQLVHGGARMVYVGKEAGFHTRSQAEIHDLLCYYAERGSSVLRLKGGDPYIFGRGGEEAAFLRARGIEVACVPGITAASGVAAALGIPLTHRGLASGVRFLTGHAREGGRADLDEITSSAADADTTLVVYMGLGTLPALVVQLLAGGLSNQTPAAAVERGTTPQQRMVCAELHNLVNVVEAAALRSPTLILVGRVVVLSPHWSAARGDESATPIVEGCVSSS